MLGYGMGNQNIGVVMPELRKTQRGFNYIEFNDYYNEKCSLQKSSLATEECIWFGVSNPKLTVFADKNKGKYIETEMPETFMVSGRMHLTREHVRQLLPFLQNFANTGNLTDKK